MRLSMSSRLGGRRGIGRDFGRSLWPGGRAFEFSCCPGGTLIFVRSRDHKSFLGVGNLVIFDLTFLPGGREFDSNLFWKMSKSLDSIRLVWFPSMLNKRKEKLKFLC